MKILTVCNRFINEPQQRCFVLCSRFNFELKILLKLDCDSFAVNDLIGNSIICFLMKMKSKEYTQPTLCWSDASSSPTQILHQPDNQRGNGVRIVKNVLWLTEKQNRRHSIFSSKNEDATFCMNSIEWAWAESMHFFTVNKHAMMSRTICTGV